MVLRLEVFESTERRDVSGTVVLDSLALEEAKLAAYENGYSAGWEDAAAAQSDDRGRIEADLARNLQALGFTYQEARNHVLRAMEPLLNEIVGRLLPVVAQEALAPLIRDELRPLVNTLSSPPVTVILHPSVRLSVEEMLAKAPAIPFTVKEEGSLGPGEVRLQLEAQETRIDLTRAIEEIKTALRNFFALPERTT